MTARRFSLVAFVLLLIVAAVLFSAAIRITPYVRNEAIAALESRFESDLELASFQASVFPRPEIAGSGLVLRHKGRTDVPPLIKIGSYSASAGLLGLIRSPLHLKTVELNGLEISIPPGGMRGLRSGGDAPTGQPEKRSPAAASASRRRQPQRRPSRRRLRV